MFWKGICFWILNNELRFKNQLSVFKDRQVILYLLDDLFCQLNENLQIKLFFVSSRQSVFYHSIYVMNDSTFCQSIWFKIRDWSDQRPWAHLLKTQLGQLTKPLMATLIRTICQIPVLLQTLAKILLYGGRSGCKNNSI